MSITSGLYNSLTTTRDQIITASLRRLRVLNSGQAPSANDLIDCSLELNNLLKMWATKGLLLWLYDLVQIPMIQNKYRYTIGPNGDADPGYRPLRALEGSFIRTTCIPPITDTQLQLLSRLEYLQYSQKATLGIPNSFYYDVQQGPGPNPVAYDPYAQGWGVLYIFTAPSDSTRTIFLNVERPIQDVTAADQTFDLPLEWYQALVKVLAAEVADYFEVPEDRITRIKREADAALEYIADWGSQEWAPMTFQPDYQFGMYNRR